MTKETKTSPLAPLLNEAGLTVVPYSTLLAMGSLEASLLYPMTMMDEVKKAPYAIQVVCNHSGEVFRFVPITRLVCGMQRMAGITEKEHYQSFNENSSKAMAGSAVYNNCLDRCIYQHRAISNSLAALAWTEAVDIYPAAEVVNARNDGLSAYVHTRTVGDFSVERSEDHKVVLQMRYDQIAYNLTQLINRFEEADLTKSEQKNMLFYSQLSNGGNLIIDSAIHNGGVFIKRQIQLKVIGAEDNEAVVLGRQYAKMNHDTAWIW